MTDSDATYLNNKAKEIWALLQKKIHDLNLGMYDIKILADTL